MLSLALSFASPYFWETSDNPTLFSALTTTAAFPTLCGLGFAIDRYRKKEHSNAERTQQDCQDSPGREIHRYGLRGNGSYRAD